MRSESPDPMRNPRIDGMRATPPHVPTLDRLSDLVVATITFPMLNYLYNRRGILSSYRALTRSQFEPVEVLRDIQLKKLQRLLTYANDHVLFYQRRFAAIGLDPRDVQALEDIEQIPPLNRQELLDHLPDLVDIRQRESLERAMRATTRGRPIPLARFRRHRLVRDATSGSTGTPTVVFEDGSKTALNWAHELRLQHWYGLRPGVKEARFAAVSTEYRPSGKTIFLRKHLWHQLNVPCENLNDEVHRANVARLRSFRPTILWGTTFGFASLADYIRRSGDDLASRPALIITWAEGLLTHDKQLIEEVFRCPVANVYSTREVGHVGATCSHGTMHVNQENYYLESAPTPVEVTGDSLSNELMITPLRIGPMPLIRYRVGDFGEMSDQRCACGLSLQAMTGLDGRTGDVYRGTDGTTISLNFWVAVFARSPIAQSVSAFQVVYTVDGGVRLRIVKNADYSDEIESRLRSYMETNFPAGTRFEFDYPTRIEPQPSGKYLKR